MEPWLQETVKNTEGGMSGEEDESGHRMCVLHEALREQPVFLPGSLQHFALDYFLPFSHGETSAPSTPNEVQVWPALPRLLPGEAWSLHRPRTLGQNRAGKNLRISRKGQTLAGWVEEEGGLGGVGGSCSLGGGSQSSVYTRVPGVLV